MSPVGLPILQVGSSDLRIVKDDQILRVFLLGRLCEIEGTREKGFTVDQNHFVVGDGGLRPDDRDSGLRVPTSG